MSNKEKHLHDLLASLPEEERIILTLFYVKSHTAAEIATLLGVPMRAVESVLQMGRQRLLAALGIEGS
jgi:RNA polymerase sigma factor (sigma-70 family)